MGIGMPKLSITFRAAAEEVNGHSKRGTVGIILREAPETVRGVHILYGAEDIPAGLGAANRAYVKGAFTGSELGTPGKVILAVAGTEPEEGATVELEAALALLQPHIVDYLAPPPDCSGAEAELIAAWVAVERGGYRPVKACLPNTAADSVGVINVSMDGAAAGDRVYTSGELCARIAGILAGTPSGCSATGAVLSELTSAAPPPDPDKAVDEGKLILVHDGMKVKLGRAVNSLVTVPPEGSEDWKKIKIVEGMDLITYFLRTSVDDRWRGRYPNDYDHHCLLLTAIREFFAELEGTVIKAGSGWCSVDTEAKKKWLKAHGTESGSMTDRQLREASCGSMVFTAYGAELVDAMEDFVFRGTLA